MFLSKKLILVPDPMAIDAIIGMEFFDSTLIFIDFSNRKIYFYEYPEKVENDSASASQKKAGAYQTKLEE